MPPCLKIVAVLYIKYNMGCFKNNFPLIFFADHILEQNGKEGNASMSDGQDASKMDEILRSIKIDFS